ARFIERLGGNRRRGAGRCEMKVNDYSENEIKAWLDWLKQNPNPAITLNPEAHPPDEKLEVRATGDWVRIPLIITTITPVIVPQRTIGNLVKTLDYIPGTHLLPFITDKLDKPGVNIRSAIAHGDLVVTNATPVVNHKPGRPTPLNLYYRK